MTRWLIGIFLRFLSPKDCLINCGGWEDELFNLFEVLSHSLFDRENNLCFNIVKFVIVFQCFRNMTNQQNL